MKAHQVKILMLLLTTFLILNLPSSAQSVTLSVPNDNQQTERDAEKASNDFENGLLALQQLLAQDAERRQEAQSQTASVAGASVSGGQREVPSSPSQLEKISNDLRSCTLGCKQVEVGCLKKASTSCLNTFQTCSLKCTKDFCNAATRIPDPQINDEVGDAQRAQRDIIGRQIGDVLKLAAALVRHAAIDAGTIAAMSKHTEYGEPERQSVIRTLSKNDTVCDIQNTFQMSQCDNNALASVNADDTGNILFNSSVCGCLIGDSGSDDSSGTGLFGQIDCAKATNRSSGGD
jgi:hypothetical protein